MADINLVFTRHAEDMLVERRIDRQWVRLTIDDPYKIETDPNRAGVLRAFRKIPENGGRTLRVAYVPDGESLRILTVFFDRTRQKK